MKSPTPTDGTNSTPVATTDKNTATAATFNNTTLTTGPTNAVNNSTPAKTTDLTSTPTATAGTTSTPNATSGLTAMTTATTPITGKNSTTFTTHVNTTMPTTNSTAVTTPVITTATPTTTVTNTTPNVTTNLNTTTPTTNSTAVTTPVITTATPTTTVTNSTTISTTHLNTTKTTAVTNSTTFTTHVNTTMLTTNSTAVTTPEINTAIPTTVTNSTTFATTHVNTTTPTTNSTAVTTPVITTETPTTTVTNTTPNATTNLNTTTPTTNSTAVTTPVITTASPTTTVTNSTTIATTHLNTKKTTAVTNSTAVTTPVITTATPTTNVTTTGTPTIYDVDMRVTLELTFTEELNDPSSSTYKTLQSRMDPVLEEQYKGITGFINVSITAFRSGSTITEFVVQTTQVISDEFIEANQKLREALNPIAPVNIPVTASYNSSDLISLSKAVTFTEERMILTCGPPPDNLNVGEISFEWKFNQKKIQYNQRIKENTDNDKSVLTILKVLRLDIGLYECTLKGSALNIFQEKPVTDDNIKQAPILRLKSKIHVECKKTEREVPLNCCVQSPYKVKWYQGDVALSTTLQEGQPNCITHNYKLKDCSQSENTISFRCAVEGQGEDYQMTTVMTIFRGDFLCDDEQYGTGKEGDISSIGCNEGQSGERTARCQDTGDWKLIEDTCIITRIKELLIVSQDLVEDQVEKFTEELAFAVEEDKEEIANSSATISAIVDILTSIADISTNVSQSVMKDVLFTVDYIMGDDSRQSWAFLNANETRNVSSDLLGSLETLSEGLIGEFSIRTPRILLNRTTFYNSFKADLNSSIVIDISNTNTNYLITTIALSSFNNVMPSRNASVFNATSDFAINAAVVLVQINGTIQNVTLSYDKLNNSLSLNPQCVFWNFALFNELGAWDEEGCTFVSDINDTVTCRCNHLTSFSILMATDIPPELREALDIITYVGVGISLACLVICLIIEGYVWKAITRNSTAYMRHVSIINTALSLLIADICFIIGASFARNPLENPGEDTKVPIGPCSTATFFMHFFYLAMFFWMLVSGLLLFYRTVMVFSIMSKSAMLAIGFCLGYGCPLIIAVITVAVTAGGNGYIRIYDACWLNWTETKALLAMVIPALSIVMINILITIVVLFKILRRGVGDSAQADEKHTLLVILRCIAILTPLFGLTWSLGVGTMISSTNKGIHIAFAFFNSLQGFFILMFGTLIDSKVRSILVRKVSTPSTGSNPTRSTSGGLSSNSGLNLINRLLGRRHVYHMSSAANSSSNGTSESFSNI